MAIQCAKYFEIEIDRNNQSSFMMFEGPKDHADESVKIAQTFIEDNLQSRITVDQLSNMVGVGRRTLERRFKKTTFNTQTIFTGRKLKERGEVLKQVESDPRNHERCRIF